MLITLFAAGCACLGIEVGVIIHKFKQATRWVPKEGAAWLLAKN